MKNLHQRTVRSLPRHKMSALRRGAAVVECALTAPLLAIAVLGVIEVGHFINVSQSVSSASRMAARLASRQDTQSTSTVESKVEEYLLANGIPNNSVSVTIRDSSGNTISGDEISSIASGESISVNVEVGFSLIRRTSAMNFLDGASNSSTTTMRRD